MPAIIKEDVLRRKNKETSGKEKVNKIMDTIVESSVVTNPVQPDGDASNSTQTPGQPTVNTTQQNIFTSEILVEGENSADLADLKNRLTKELKPSGEINSILVDRIVANIWRLKRCLRIENQVLEYEISCIQEYEQGFFRTRKRTSKEVQQLKALKISDDKSRINNLSQYETALEEQLYKALSELNKLKRREMGTEKKVLKKSK